ncbi:hypothetical protein BI364_00515 [Acidihalobacter yilgarnensis]|uniref:SnoaL-like domain-containing protein n=1 Tax=Acidihalobacter yilgarnensis TaxID=2819280 RepID=A0A1D8IJQ7_9GAMM|nr:nuclear transport factor 2 family protein [Acidihalobacter yilgarnensis]AOU96702.1 hypothetical protein BI364_00515 [Acidihalobacter yilgarnensis]
MSGFATAEACEAAYYAALQAADAEAMIVVWADMPEVVCMHPGPNARPQIGFRAVLEGWLGVFSRALDVRILPVCLWREGDANLAVHVGEERIVRAGELAPSGLLHYCNTYRRFPEGWRMVAHLATPQAASVIPIPRVSQGLH